MAGRLGDILIARGLITDEQLQDALATQGSRGMLGDSLVAVIAGRVSVRLLANRSFAVWRERVTGIVLIAIALPLAFAARE